MPRLGGFGANAENVAQLEGVVAIEKYVAHHLH